MLLYVILSICISFSAKDLVIVLFWAISGFLPYIMLYQCLHFITFTIRQALNSTNCDCLKLIIIARTNLWPYIHD